MYKIFRPLAALSVLFLVQACSEAVPHSRTAGPVTVPVEQWRDTLLMEGGEAGAELRHLAGYHRYRSMSEGAGQGR